MPTKIEQTLNEFFNRARIGSGMTDSRDDILTVLRKQEAALLALLEAVRQAIHKVQPGTASLPPLQPGEEGLLMNQVLAGLGTQFTSAEIFETAKRIKPGFKRTSLERAIGWLQKSGVILKIEEGRGRRPARYEKRTYN